MSVTPISEAISKHACYECHKHHRAGSKASRECAALIAHAGIVGWDDEAGRWTRATPAPSAELVEAVGPSAANAYAAGELAAMPVIMANIHRAPVGSVPTGREIPPASTNAVGTGRMWMLRAHGVKFGPDHMNEMMRLQAYNSPMCVPGTPDDIRAHRTAMAMNGRYPFAPVRRYMPTPTVDALLDALAGRSDGLGYLWGTAYVPDYASTVAPWEGRLAMIRAHGVYGMWETKAALNAINDLAWERAESLRRPDDCGGEFCDGGDTCGPCAVCARAERWHAANPSVADAQAERVRYLRLVDDKTSRAGW